VQLKEEDAKEVHLEEKKTWQGKEVRLKEEEVATNKYGDK
jgi:hypothetical protein